MNKHLEQKNRHFVLKNNNKIQKEDENTFLKNQEDIIKCEINRQDKNTIIIISVVYNKPSFIPYQYECLNKFITVPFKYIIFDNSESKELTKEFETICKYLNVNYIRVPQNIHIIQDTSNRSGKSLDWSLQYMYYNLNYRGILMVNEYDLFITSFYDPVKRLGEYCIAGRSAYNSSIYSESKIDDQIKNLNYYTKEFLIINYAKLINIKDFSFMPTIINDCVIGCGGMLDQYLKKNQSMTNFNIIDISSNYLSVENINTVPKELIPYFKKEIILFSDFNQTNTLKEKAYSEIFENVFIYLRDGSNSINQNDIINLSRENNLFSFLCSILIDWQSIINPSDDNKYIISFSLYGNNHKYNYNAIINASLTNIIYPGWKSRFYYDNTVPSNIIEAINTIPNTETILMINKKIKPGSERMLWRFIPAAENNVAAMISRDSDSWLSFREAFSVRSWIESNKGFHILRDHCHHSKKIMGGMWGIKRGIIPHMKELCNDFIETDTYDQGFLEEFIYPKIKDSVLVHLGDQYTSDGFKAFGYFQDGGINIVNYPKICEYISLINIETINNLNKFYCAHCKKIHSFFIGGMFNNLDKNTIKFLFDNFPMLK